MLCNGVSGGHLVTGYLSIALLCHDGVSEDRLIDLGVVTMSKVGRFV